MTTKQRNHNNTSAQGCKATIDVLSIWDANQGTCRLLFLFVYYLLFFLKQQQQVYQHPINRWYA